MIHSIRFLRKAPDRGDDEFFAHYHECHAPLLRSFPQIRRAVICRPLLGVGPDPGFDGVSELWLDRESDLDALFADSRYQDSVAADEPRFIDVGATVALRTVDRPILAQDRPASVKLFYAIKRRPGSTLAEFRHYYEKVHTTVSTRPPFQRVYVQCHVLDSAYAAGEPPYDGVSRIGFEDLAGLRGYLDSPELAAGVADCRNFLDMDRFLSFVGEEHRVV